MTSKNKGNNMSNKFGFKRGIFKLIEIENGVEKVIENDNTIVLTSFDIVVGALQGDTDKLISYLALGDGGVVNSVIQTPSRLDKTLYSETFTVPYKEILIENIIEPYHLTYRFELLEEEGNGAGSTIYSEAGLMSADGTMFARKTFFETIKTPEKKLIVEWKLEYSN